MDNILTKLATAEEDQKKLDELNHLQNMVDTVKKNYFAEYSQNVQEVVNNIRNKLENNPKITKVVNDYIDNYVRPEKKEEARDMLYTILSAEIAALFQTLSHSSCSIA